MLGKNMSARQPPLRVFPAKQVPGTRRIPTLFVYKVDRVGWAISDSEWNGEDNGPAIRATAIEALRYAFRLTRSRIKRVT